MEKEGKVEKVEAGGIGGLGGEKKVKLQLYVMSYDMSRWKSHAITNGDVSFCCPSVRTVPENNCIILSPTFVLRWHWKC